MELLGLADDGILVPVVVLREVQLSGARRSEERGAGTEVLISTCGLSNGSQGAGKEEDEKSEGHHEEWCFVRSPPRTALGWQPHSGQVRGTTGENQGPHRILVCGSQKSDKSV